MPILSFENNFLNQMIEFIEILWISRIHLEKLKVLK